MQNHCILIFLHFIILQKCILFLNSTSSTHYNCMFVFEYFWSKWRFEMTIYFNFKLKRLMGELKKLGLSILFIFKVENGWNSCMFSQTQLQQITLNFKKSIKLEGWQSSSTFISKHFNLELFNFYAASLLMIWSNLHSIKRNPRFGNKWSLPRWTMMTCWSFNSSLCFNHSYSFPNSSGFMPISELFRMIGDVPIASDTTKWNTAA